MWNVVLILLCAALAGSIRAEDPQPEKPEPAGAEAGPEAGEETGDAVDPEPDTEPRTVHLLIQGSEADRWHLDAGGGWNDDDGLYGRLALSSTNFLGRGEDFSATVEVGDEHELYELAYRRRFLFGRRQSLGFRLFKDAGDHPVAGRADFGQRRAGTTITWGRRFRARQSFELEYRYADVDQHETALGPEGVPPEGGPRNVLPEAGAPGELLSRRSAYASSSLASSWVLDRLDDTLSPRRGRRLDASLEAAGGVLGGDVELLEGAAGLTWFKPLTGGRLRSSFAVRGRLGWLEPAGGELFAQQRLFTGGEDSVRGFRRRSIAALEGDGDQHPASSVARDADGFPLGGDRLAQLNLEYHMLFSERLRLVLFADAGGVAAGRSLDTGDLRTSAGAELRVTLPKLRVPLRLIWARNLDPLPDDDFRDLSFSVGVSF